MLTKNETKYIQSLYQKKQRDEDQVFVAEGPKLVAELLNCSYEIKKIYATAGWIQTNGTVSAPVTEVSNDDLKRISNLQTPNEVLLIAKQNPVQTEPSLHNQLTLVLDGIQDPGNMGAIIRIADWFGIQQIVCSNDCVDMYNPKVVQSTMGSIIRVNCWYKDLSELETKNLPVYGALLNGKNIYSFAKVTEGMVVIGNESKGIRQPLLSKITHPVTIPKAGGAESLNAAVAAGIIVGHFVNAR